MLEKFEEAISGQVQKFWDEFSKHIFGKLKKEFYPSHFPESTSKSLDLCNE